MPQVRSRRIPRPAAGADEVVPPSVVTDCGPVPRSNKTLNDAHLTASLDGAPCGHGASVVSRGFSQLCTPSPKRTLPKGVRVMLPAA
jgi:hypothetical protein